ncbi:Uu.00g052140.m01.CDS01 [Anthostomella pinea]|uniref:Uu.00g052140.m01.CDS01 n=1 Tax=Anthostomella pinea TaxID=933095 RepID=A0AAI8YPA5_9PEZI|nr:Uu.00g052140.m01.CDS01 [Anthostomella pinea]
MRSMDNRMALLVVRLPDSLMALHLVIPAITPLDLSLDHHDVTTLAHLIHIHLLRLRTIPILVNLMDIRDLPLERFILHIPGRTLAMGLLDNTGLLGIMDLLDSTELLDNTGLMGITDPLLESMNQTTAGLSRDLPSNIIHTRLRVQVLQVLRRVRSIRKIEAGIDVADMAGTITDNTKTAAQSTIGMAKMNGVVPRLPIIGDLVRDLEPGEVNSQSHNGSDHEVSKPSTDTNGNESPNDPNESPYFGFRHDARCVFGDLECEGGKADPIAAPLPSEWFDGVMIPPPFGAKSVKSKFVTPSNVDDFSQSVRDTKSWHHLQHHPLLVDPEDIRMEKLEDYERALRQGPVQNRDRNNNHKGKGRGKRWDPPGRPFKNHNRDYSRDVPRNERHGRPESRKRRWDGSHNHPDARQWDKPEAEVQYDELALKYGEPEYKRPKPASPEPGEVAEPSKQEPTSREPTSQEPRPGTPVIPVDDPAWAPESAEVARDKPEPSNRGNENRATTSEIQGPSERETRASSEPKDWDRDAFVASKLSEFELRNQNGERPPTPPPPPPGRPPSSRSRRSSRSYRGSHPNSRRSSFGAHLADSMESPLTPTELELLGMGRPSTSGSDTGRDSPKRQSDDVTPKFRRRQPKVHDAYSRRW